MISRPKLANIDRLIESSPRRQNSLRIRGCVVVDELGERPSRTFSQPVRCLETVHNDRSLSFLVILCHLAHGMIDLVKV